MKNWRISLIPLFQSILRAVQHHPTFSYRRNILHNCFRKSICLWLSWTRTATGSPVWCGFGDALLKATRKVTVCKRQTGFLAGSNAQDRLRPNLAENDWVTSGRTPLEYMGHRKERSPPLWVAVRFVNYPRSCSAICRYTFFQNSRRY